MWIHSIIHPFIHSNIYRERCTFLPSLSIYLTVEHLFLDFSVCKFLQKTLIFPLYTRREILLKRNVYWLIDSYLYKFMYFYFLNSSFNFILLLILLQLFLLNLNVLIHLCFFFCLLLWPIVSNVILYWNHHCSYSKYISVLVCFVVLFVFLCFLACFFFFFSSFL